MRTEHFILNRLLDERAGIKRVVNTSSEPIYHYPTVIPQYGQVQPSLGTRKSGLKSPKNYRGTQPNQDGTREMTFDSGVELGIGHKLRVDRDVIELREQYPTAKYFAAGGKLHKHTFDYWVRLRNGKTVAIAVKPMELIIRTGLLRILKRIHRQSPGKYADIVTWIDEDHWSDEDDENAKTILWARRRRNEAECASLLKTLECVTGLVRFWDLIAIAPVEAHRRVAIWNLIGDGVLAAVQPGLVTDTTLLQVNL
ncbi:hypothetical protein ASC97_31925 [Rhizobium sp. Root1203]|uniref:TnsA endonuclease N-terminal domain-containing protein n=1 Tax=Rhizobium sp. Root1203 TaxID=1736427 RepID=UPI000710335D|nr:TnsA endonuclease N-terminal domain-containing protein [Rhizobium sp. Root1203]KQV13718.1 hypothetical protein ASC97_31925 [Rhizobium sp. Root1203]